MTAVSMVLAQALPPVWVMALAAFLLVGIPLALTWSTLALVVTLTPSRKTLARFVATSALVFSMLNVVLATVFVRLDREPTPMSAEDAVWAAVIVGAVALAALATWRAARAT